MDMATDKECLQELRGHIEAAEGLLSRIDNDRLHTAFEEIKDLLLAEEKKLLWEEKKQAVRPFFGLRSELPAVQAVLTNGQQALEQKMAGANSEAELEKVLRPYVKLLEAMKCQDPLGKMDYLEELRGVLSKDLLAYTLMQGNVILAEDTGEEQPGAAADLPEKPEQQEKSPAGAAGAAAGTSEAAQEKEEEPSADSPERAETVAESEEDLPPEDGEAADTSEHVSQETAAFFQGLLLPADYDYGQLDCKENPKGKKEAGVSEMKSDIMKAKVLKEAVCKALKQMAEYSVVSISFLQAQLHGLKEEKAAEIAAAALEFLQKKGYTEKYILDGRDTIYCTSFRLRKLLQQKTACQFLGVEQAKKNSEDKEVIAKVEAKHVVTRLAWLAIYEKYWRGLSKGGSMQNVGGCSGFV
jgi:hypothetical protein